jgi:hypothetical protein
VAIEEVLRNVDYDTQFDPSVEVQEKEKMRLAAVTTVRNECDIVESFVRHNAAFFDRLYILDNRSTDKTPAILRGLASEGLPLALSRDDAGVFYQGPTMTRLIKGAYHDHRWDFVVPLDCDEFVRMPDRAALEAALADLNGATIGHVDVVNYIPTADDDAKQIDVPRRIVHRAKTIPEIAPKIGKVVIPGAVIGQAGFALAEGHHGVSIDREPVPERRLEAVTLAHFPVRSIDQFIMRTILCRLAWASRSDYDPGWGWHYETFIEHLKKRPIVSAVDLTAAALLYVDIYTDAGRMLYQKVLVREPMTLAYDRLRFTDFIDVAVLPPILDMMDVLLDELRAARKDDFRLQAENDRLRADDQQHRREVMDMLASTSWRLTAPIRAGGRALSALGALGRRDSASIAEAKKADPSP